VIPADRFRMDELERRGVTCWTRSLRLNPTTVTI
jgi:hypothetical protein